MQYGLKIVVDNPGWLITSRDFPELTSGAPRGTTKEFAAGMGLEALQVVFELMMEQGKQIRMPTPVQEGETAVTISLNAQIKILIWNELRAQNLKPAQIASLIKPVKYSMTFLKDLDCPISLDAIAAFVRALGMHIAYDFI
jgi:antitoxin HicB